MNAAILTLVATALTGPLVQDAPAAPSGQGLYIDRCVVAIIDDINVPAREAGLLEEVVVKEGDEMAAGALLGKLDTTDALIVQKVASIEVTIAQRQAETMVDVEAAEKAAEVSEEELKDSLVINETAPGTVPKTQIRREGLTAERAGFQHQAAIIKHAVDMDNHSLKNAELQGATSRLNRHEIRSPLDGEVAQIIRRPGNWVQPGDPVIRIVRMNRLRVEGLVEGEKAAPSQILNRDVKITVQRGAEGDVELHAKITFVSNIVEANGKYRVWAEVENKKVGGHWNIRPGLEATMDIQLGKLPNE